MENKKIVHLKNPENTLAGDIITEIKWSEPCKECYNDWHESGKCPECGIEYFGPESPPRGGFKKRNR